MRYVLLAAVVAMVGCAKHTTPAPLAAANQDASAKRAQQLLGRLDDDPDILHVNYTPAVHDLIAMGEPAIEPTLPYLLSERETTRLHAERVIVGIMLTMHGFVFGQGWSRPDAEQEFRTFYKTLWDYEAMSSKSPDESSVQDRQAYIERVKRWLASRRV